MRYQFQSESSNLAFKSRNFTDAIKILISINALLFLLRYIAQSQFDLAQIFGLSSNSVWPMIWQPFTYMFIHGDFFHVFMNMFVLWMFGSEMESIWGKKEFLKFYFITGIGSGLIWLVFNFSGNAVLIGASGAIYGILLAYGLMFPNRKVLIYFLFPVKVKYFVIFLGLMAFVSSLSYSGSNISHLTHLSGMMIGFVYMKSKWTIKRFSLLLNSYLASIKYKKSIKKEKQLANIQANVDKLLDKVSEVGFDSLSEDEKDKLFTYSKHLGKNITKD
ncbi:rhomboid family intramembrane serine protease [Candidatus Marinimicrobia bacterium]|jgi:membrane associated rhomboid family serine protease|nr:rhomboid family intramembrane serine protease [Candidatus Neomarinimicrobiota bacterium]|tara:strand:- start:1796 stop:2620 length:825 start_codon:yes stop_codon:yes gene_type:complete